VETGRSPSGILHPCDTKWKHDVKKIMVEYDNVRSIPSAAHSWRVPGWGIWEVDVDSERKGCEDLKKRLLVMFSILAILTFAAGCTTQQTPTPAPAPPEDGQTNPGGLDPSVPPETGDGNESGDMDLALREAKELARGIGGDGVITKYEVKDVEGEQRLMEFIIQNDAQLHKVEVDRIARQAKEVEVTPNSVNMADYEAYIGLDEAERIAMERVADAVARFIAFELEDHDAQEGRPAYKFEIHTLTQGFEVKVDAMTGDIFEFENP
jgi:uncharacterized membrane protein YkoI